MPTSLSLPRCNCPGQAVVGRVTQKRAIFPALFLPYPISCRAEKGKSSERVGSVIYDKQYRSWLFIVRTRRVLSELKNRVTGLPGPATLTSCPLLERPHVVVVLCPSAGGLGSSFSGAGPLLP
ncbi:hypothetical protein JZ751_003134 [Albula glossodonta]|uniref:Uncharacterized protein n=1 Tax=Albula glossodonta TaxID=121402 RepID=A0A8T2NA53_9TELE|nr:hypothetical protein JZ751_003134 [Albula glossodonta]